MTTQNGLLSGGGLVGALSPSDTAKVGNVSGVFGVAGAGGGNEVTVRIKLWGGGLVGAQGRQATEVGDITGEARFVNNTVTTQNEHLIGGGLVGVYSQGGVATVGTVSGVFGGADGKSGNRITVGTYLFGGGVIGAVTLSITQSASLAGIDGAEFVGNTVVVGDQTPNNEISFALGGVVAVTGLEQELVIKNAVFRNNALTVNRGSGKALQQDMGAAVYIGTDRDTTNPDGHAVTLVADAGKTLEFSGNTVTLDGTRQGDGALLFGREWKESSGAQYDSRADAVLTVAAAAGGTILLNDAVLVDMKYHTTLGDKSFSMTVDNAAGGVFRWGGDNRWRVRDAGNAALDFEGGATAFVRDYTWRPIDGTKGVVTVAAGHTLSPVLPKRNPNLALFNFTDAAANSSWTAAAGATWKPVLDGLTSLTRIDNVADRYLLINDLDAIGLDDMTVLNSELADYSLAILPKQTWLVLENVVDPAIFYGYSTNARSLVGLADDLIAAEGLSFTEDEYIALAKDLPNLTAENILVSAHFNSALTRKVAAIALGHSRIYGLDSNPAAAPGNCGANALWPA